MEKCAFLCFLSSYLLSKFTILAAPTVTFDGTTFTGVDRPNSKQFQGIKYADAPRFRAPVPVTVASLSASYDATSPGPMCMQYCPPIPAGVCLATKPSEDCLFLNIFTPKGNPSQKNVVLYLHGGNFRSNTGASDLYDGDLFVKTGDVVLVTINYRLGAFGFLGVRNVGIKDMITAIQWVEDNISQFGGNPLKITVMGQSAGGLSIPILLTNPDVKDKIYRVIIQSAPLSLRFRTAKEATAQEGKLAKALGCPSGDTACYDKASATDILKYQEKDEVYTYSSDLLASFMPWGPSIDGTLVLDSPYNLFFVPQFRSVDIIIGEVEDEGILYVANEPSGSMSVAELDATLNTVLPGLTSSTTRLLYPLHPTDQRFTLAQMTTDYVFRCPSLKVARILKARGVHAYKYTFKAIFPYPIWGALSNCDSFSCHGIDTVYTFNTAYLGGYKLPASHISLSTAMIEFFTNFAKTGVANRYTYSLWQRTSHPGPTWYETHEQPLQIPAMMLLEPGSRTSYFFHAYRNELEKCLFFNTIDQYN